MSLHENECDLLSMESMAGQTIESLGVLKYKTLQALAKSCGIRANLSKDNLIKVQV